MHFELLGRDGAGRLGKWHTPHGVVETPALLPVIHPGRQAIPASEMHAKFGVRMVITNSYIAWRDPWLRQRALDEGIRQLIGFPGPVMTDSGTFQMYFYGRTIEVGNAQIVDFQRRIGSTVGTILDIFATPGMTEEEAGQAVDTTLARAREAVQLRGQGERFPHEAEERMGLALPVQGGTFPALRERSAREAAQLDAAMHPIGGVVPLMEQQRYRDLAEVIAASQRALPAGKPVHLFGAGHPLVFPLAALLGCDLFDSASYSKFAQDERLILPDGTAHLRELEELPCACPVCANTTAQELRSLPQQEREGQLARHNLHVSMAELRRVRQAMRDGRLWELVEQRCRAHPALLDGLRALAGHTAWLERKEPVSKPAAFFYTGPETLTRPTIVRLQQRLLTHYRSPCDQACVVESSRPFGRHVAGLWAKARNHGIQLLVKTPWGAVPAELDDMYPLAQSANPELWDRDAGKGFTRHLDAMLAAHGWKLLDRAELDALPDPERGEGMERAHVAAVCDVQFGRGAGDALLRGELGFRRSATTGKVRNVYSQGEHVLSLRASDGLFTLKLAGARRLHERPGLRVVVDGDSAPFQREGRNAFSRFVRSIDPALRPEDECLVVDEADALLACGRIVLPADEVGTFAKGMAVQVREGIAPRSPDAA
ncbi:MAG: tRNA guanosine(15) transglycosylase TgtA [Halobacteriales archaeon]|nr:tRNA guanosine(15) transglycosylase TgtA [Halobacteriales archaeon]